MSAATAALSAPTLDSLVIDAEARSASVGGAELYLSESEFGLLAALAEDPHRTLTYEELEPEISAGRPGGGRRLVDAAAARLRRKLELRGVGALIAPCRGVGFRLLETAEPGQSDPDERGAAGIGGAR